MIELRPFERATITLDYNGSPDEVDRYAQVFRCEGAALDVEVVTEHGPAGGNPVVKFTGTIEQVTALYASYTGWGLPEYMVDSLFAGPPR